ncbi:MAG: hypothetical protein IK079_01645, partial [Desulfovibrio sp.]|nr:hypothetical protein [Desulfovibrio sp.]
MRIHVVILSSGQKEKFSFSLKKEMTLIQAISLTGNIAPRPLCSGLGRCGLCKIRCLTEHLKPTSRECALLTERELATGVRLGCEHVVRPTDADVEVEIEDKREQKKRVLRAESCVGLGLDLGTTNVCWQAVRLDTMQTLAQGSFLNPQSGMGSDVVQRLLMAQNCTVRHLMAELVRKQIRILCAELGDVQKICLVANTAMTDIFLEREVANLC